MFILGLLNAVLYAVHQNLQSNISGQSFKGYYLLHCDMKNCAIISYAAVISW